MALLRWLPVAAALLLTSLWLLPIVAMLVTAAIAIACVVGPVVLVGLFFGFCSEWRSGDTFGAAFRRFARS
jgi:hypothetical protein